MQKWLDDYCEVGEDFFERYSVLTESYNGYLKEEEKSRMTVTRATLIKKLTQKGFIKERINEGKGSNRRRIRVIMGVRVRLEAEEFENEPSNVIDFKGRSD